MNEMRKLMEAIEKIEDGKWDYQKRDKGKGVGSDSPMYDGGAKNRKSRKAFRKAEKAKAHQARMRGELDEGSNEPIQAYIKNEANDLAICVGELNRIADLARQDGSDATAGSVDAAVQHIKEAVAALERAEGEFGTSLDSLGHENALGNDHEANFGGWPDEQR
jgi:hypothetical protein